MGVTMFHGKPVVITFHRLHAFTFCSSVTHYQRVCFTTRPGLRHELLRAAIGRLVGSLPENLTWDSDSGEGSFCHQKDKVRAGMHELPYHI